MIEQNGRFPKDVFDVIILEENSYGSKRQVSQYAGAPNGFSWTTGGL